MHQLVTPNCTWLALWRYLWQVLFWLHDNNIDHLSVVDATLPRACPEQTGGTGNFPFLTRSEKKTIPLQILSRPSSKVCVRLCVGHNRQLCKNGWTDWDTIWTHWQTRCEWLMIKHYTHSVASTVHFRCTESFYRSPSSWVYLCSNVSLSLCKNSKSFSK